MNVSDPRRAILLMLVFVGLWAAIETLAWQVLQHHSPYQVVWTRYGVHLLLMLLLFGWRQPMSLVRTRRPVFQVARSLLMLGMPAFWVMGMQAGLGGDEVMTVFWISPLLIVVLGRLFLHDEAPLSLWVATVVAGVGSLLTHELHAIHGIRLLAYPLGMALCFSLYVVMTRSLRTEPTRVNLFYSALGVFLALTPVMPSLWVTPSAADLAVMVAVGVLGCLSLWALDRSTAAAPVSLGAPVAYMQIAFTFAVFIGLGVLGHGLSTRRLALGLLLIVGAAIYVWMRGARLRLRDSPAGPAPR